MAAIDFPSARRLGVRVVLGQAVVTGLVALLSWAFGSPASAMSALVGGGISTLASSAMVAVAFGRRRADAARMVIAFYAGEGLKLIVVIVLLVVVLKSMKVSPLPLFGAYAATFAVHWWVFAAELRLRSG